MHHTRCDEPFQVPIPIRRRHFRFLDENDYCQIMMLKLGQYSIYNCDPIVLTQLACFVGRYWDFVDSLNLFKQLHLLDTNFCLVRYAR